MAATSSAPSLRLQIIASLGTLLVLAFLPLFFAVASLSRATAIGAANDEAQLRAKSIAAHMEDARAAHALEGAVEKERKIPGVVAILISDRDSKKTLAATDALPDDWSDPAKDAAQLPTPRAGFLDLVTDSGATRTHVRFRTADVESRVAPLLQLSALYIFLFGTVVLAFAYLALTRLIVRPIDSLSREAERVAAGGRKFRAPEHGAREIADLGASVRAMTDALVANEASLKKKVDELTLTTARLSQARAQLVSSERLAGVGKLAAGIAHEIGNPIAAMMGMLDLLADESLSKEERADLLRRTQRETERVSSIVRDLLDFARPDKADASGPTSLRLAISTVDAAVRDVLSLVSAQKSFKRIALTTDIASGLLVTLPEERLEQVLLNLLLNAVHALEKVQDATISIVATKAGERAVIVVEDNGPGVPENARTSIFEPFFTTKDVGQGTGLGLSVCRGLVEAVGGEIVLDETYTKGARFRLTLPIAD